jgi:hypothetical protein
MKDLFLPFGSIKTTADPSLSFRMTTYFLGLAEE